MVASVLKRQIVQNRAMSTILLATQLGLQKRKRLMLEERSEELSEQRKTWLRML